MKGNAYFPYNSWSKIIIKDQVIIFLLICLSKWLNCRYSYQKCCSILYCDFLTVSFFWDHKQKGWFKFSSFIFSQFIFRFFMEKWNFPHLQWVKGKEMEKMIREKVYVYVYVWWKKLAHYTFLTYFTTCLIQYTVIVKATCILELKCVRYQCLFIKKNWFWNEKVKKWKSQMKTRHHGICSWNFCYIILYGADVLVRRMLE